MTATTRLLRRTTCALMMAAALSPFAIHAYQDTFLSTDDDSVVRYDRADGVVVYAFTNAAGDVAVTPACNLQLEEMLLAGGGGAGGWTIGGGGGGGGVVTNVPGVIVAPADVPFTLSVGAGGNNFPTAGGWVSGGPGGATTLAIGGTNFVACGGGGGAGWNVRNAADTSPSAPIANGGGGAGQSGNVGGKGGAGLFFTGGDVVIYPGSNNNAPGGGAGAGGDGFTSSANLQAGEGGPGILSSITGVELDYCAGGGGGGGNGIYASAAGGESAGRGGNGNATGGLEHGLPGLDGRGGGGGGGAFSGATPGGRGGSGAVILAFRPASIAILNHITGSAHYTVFDSVQVVSLPQMDASDVYQISCDAGPSMDPADWTPYDPDAALPVVSFPAGTPYGTVTVYCHVKPATGTLADVETSSDSIAYLDPATAATPTASTKDITLVLDSVAGGVTVTPADVDDGSSDGTYGLFGMGVAPRVVTGDADVTLFVTNMAGAASSAVAHITATHLDFNVATNGSDATGTGRLAAPFGTISNALAKARAAYADDGNARTVYAAAGAYSAALTGEVFPLAVPEGVSLVGAGMGETILDAAYAARHITLDASSVPARVAGLSLRGAKTRAIHSAAWGGTVENVEISDVSSPDEVLYYNNGGSARDLVLSGLCVTNISSATRRFVSLVGSGTLTLTNCLFRGLSTTVGAAQANGNFQVQSNAGIGQNGWPCTMVDCVFEDISSSGAGNYEGGFITTGQTGGRHVVDRCIFRNITFQNKSEMLLCFNRSGSPLVSNSLFADISMPDTAGFSSCVGGFRSHPRVRNCTFHNCTGNVFRPPQKTGSYYTRAYNCIVSGCGSLCNHSPDTLYLYNVNLHETPEGSGYSAANSANVTGSIPYFKDAGNGDLALKPMSPLVDAGDNAYVEATTAHDLALGARIVDGNDDGTATVDLGAYEFDPSSLGARFASGAASYGLFAGGSIAIPVWIEPPQACGPVTAAISYPTNTAGAASLSFPTGLETNLLTITAWQTLDVESGSFLELGIADAGGELEATSIGLLLSDRIVTVPGHAARRFLRPEESATFTPVFPDELLKAASDLEITATAQSGDVGSLVWNGTGIPAGAGAADGALVLTGADSAGSSSITLSLPENWIFAESGEQTLDFEAVSFASPLVVSPDGSDATGIGTEALPLRTMTYAAPQLRAGEGIRLLPGVYGPTDGETFPVTIPPGIAVEGERGPAGDATDTSIVDPDATGWAFFLGTEGSDPGNVAGGALRSLVIRNTAGTAIGARYWGGTIQDCSITRLASGACAGSLEIGGGSAIAYFNSVRNGLVFDNVELGCVTSGLARAVHVAGGTGSMKMSNCWFHDIASTATCTGAGMFDIRIGPFTLEDSIVERIVAKGGSGEAQGVFYSYNFQVNYLRNIFRDIGLSGDAARYTLLGVNRNNTALIANCLFHDIASADTCAVIGGFRSAMFVRNCTFDAIPGLFQRFNDARNRYLYNSTVSDCDSFNVSPWGGSSAIVLQNVNLWNVGEGYGYTTNSSVNVVSADPLFKNAGSGNYRLQGSSVLKDAGDNALVVAATMGATDLEGNDRIFRADKGGVVDLGCYEYSIPGGTLFLLR
jgi:hypothetical protein